MPVAVVARQPRGIQAEPRPPCPSRSRRSAAGNPGAPALDAPDCPGHRRSPWIRWRGQPRLLARSTRRYCSSVLSWCWRTWPAEDWRNVDVDELGLVRLVTCSLRSSGLVGMPPFFLVSDARRSRRADLSGQLDPRHLRQGRRRSWARSRSRARSPAARGALGRGDADMEASSKEAAAMLRICRAKDSSARTEMRGSVMFAGGADPGFVPRPEPAANASPAKPPR